jgi:flagellar hook-associated protein 2
MNTLPSSRITIKSTGEDPEHAETLRLLGFSDGQSSKINTSRSIADLADKLGGGTLAPDASGKYRFSINGKSFEFDQSQSVDDMILAVNNSTAGVTLSYSEISDKFSLISNTYGASNIVAGDIGGNLLSTIFSASNSDTTNGTNAVAYINGSRVERNSNDFTIDGVHISLKSTLNAGGTLPPAPESGEAITLSPNSDKLFDAVKQFVEDYNSMMTFMRGLPKEKVYSSYEPLTDAQRAEMSEGQIKQWEEKAKSGILSGDSLINGLSTSIQGALLNTIGTNGFGLYSLGIKSAGWAENGKLELDEDALRSALDNNPDEVRALFTEAEKGISLKLDKIIDDAVRTTGVKGRRGSLIEMAGYAATNSDKENGLTRQIEDYTKSIDRFKAQLEKEESRLWSRFSMMESALERLNYQGGLLSQYLGNGQQ